MSNRYASGWLYQRNRRIQTDALTRIVDGYESWATQYVDGEFEWDGPVRYGFEFGTGEF